MPIVVNTTGTTILVGGRALPARTPCNITESALASSVVQRLLEAGDLAALGDAPSHDSSTTSSSSATDPRADLLRAVVGAFPADEPGYWTRDGRPQLTAVNAALGSDDEPFSSRERDRLWGEM